MAVEIGVAERRIGDLRRIGERAPIDVAHARGFRRQQPLADDLMHENAPDLRLGLLFRERLEQARRIPGQADDKRLAEDRVREQAKEQLAIGRRFALAFRPAARGTTACLGARGWSAIRISFLILASTSAANSTRSSSDALARRFEPARTYCVIDRTLTRAGKM